MILSRRIKTLPSKIRYSSPLSHFPVPVSPSAPLSLLCRLLSFSSVNPSRLPFPQPSPSLSSSSNIATNQTNDSSATLPSDPVRPEGCDYEHWLVVMEPPTGYPLRDEIVQGYIKTLAMVLGCEEEVKRSIYSVSTKYYYAFACKVSQELCYKIRSLPNVRWVLPDSYFHVKDKDYGGEPFVDGKVVPYEDKYHADWLRDQNIAENVVRSNRRRRKRGLFDKAHFGLIHRVQRLFHLWLICVHAQTLWYCLHVVSIYCFLSMESVLFSFV